MERGHHTYDSVTFSAKQNTGNKVKKKKILYVKRQIEVFLLAEGNGYY